MTGKRISYAEKVKIMTMAQDGEPVREIASQMNRSKSAICRLLRRSRHLPAGVTPPDKPVPGRPKKIDRGTLRRIKIALIKNPWLTAAELKNKFQNELKDVSPRTIQRRCQLDLQMPIRKAAKKPLLTRRMRIKRLKFARKMLKLTEEQWSRIMWSDESKFKCISNRRYCVRRPKHMSRYHPRYTQRTVKHPYSIMIWGAFSGCAGKAGLEFLPQNKTMDAKRYKRILIKHLPNYMDLHGCEIFMHDGAPCHTANIVKTWFHNKGIQVMEWPGNSPDLNPIENCWNQMKDKVFRNGRNMTVAQLKETISEVWNNELDLAYFKKLTDSMKRRCSEVIKARGEMTKY